MKKIIYYTLLILLFASCNDGIDVFQDYDFQLTNLPIPKAIQNGETVAIEFTIHREGHYKNTQYSFRYFQDEGEGFLMNSRGEQLSMNRFHQIESDQFTLLYQSNCEDVQLLDFVFSDNFGNEKEYSTTFQHEAKDKE